MMEFFTKMCLATLFLNFFLDNSLAIDGCVEYSYSDIDPFAFDSGAASANWKCDNDIYDCL